MSENGNGRAKYAGKSIMLGEVEYVVPSLSLRQAKELWPTILEINQGVTVDTLPVKYDLILKVIHAALSRNYPDLKMDYLSDIVDMGNIRELQLLVMGQSGIKPTPGAEPAAEKIVVQ